MLAGRLEITTFDNRDHRLPDVITHRSRLESTTAITAHLNVPIVVPPLTVVQVAQTCDPHLVKSIANDLVKRHWTDFPSILAWIDIVGDGRRQALRELCLRAIDVGGHDDSPAARRLARRLRQAGVAPYELDYQVDTPDGVLRIDIAWPRVRVGLEYNGARDHDTPLARDDDARRRCRLAALGWRMLDITRGTTDEQIVQWVFAALAVAKGARRRSTPDRLTGRPAAPVVTPKAPAGREETGSEDPLMPPAQMPPPASTERPSLPPARDETGQTPLTPKRAAPHGTTPRAPRTYPPASDAGAYRLTGSARTAGATRSYRALGARPRRRRRRSPLPRPRSFPSLGCGGGSRSRGSRCPC